ncbi:cytochrome c550 [Spirochaetia bacterium]|nr:cytochrome c550 [Spirochaetia bacterium]
MKTLGYYNGTIAEIDQMMVPMSDRACYFGDGVYDATIADNHIIFALDEHIDRFFNSASMVGIQPDITKQGLAELLSSLVKKVDSPCQFVYWQITRGAAVRTHVYPENAKPNLWVMLSPQKLPDLNKKIKLLCLDDTRFLHCNIKTLNLLPNVLASEKAKQEGCQEAVLHRSDRVTECTHSNIHILKDGFFRTAPLDHLILPGIARSHLIIHCGYLGIEVDETPFSVGAMMEADEVIVSSSSTFCLSVSHIDGKPVGGKAPDLLRQLQDSVMEEFREATKSV